MLERLLSKKNIIFDLDGTIINMRKSTIQARFGALNKVFGNNIPNSITRRKVIKTVGARFDSVLRKCGISQDKIGEISCEYDTFKKELSYLNSINEKTLRLIKNLHKQNKKIILITKKNPQEAKAALSQFGIKKYFSEIIFTKNYKEAYSNFNPDDTAIIGNMAEQQQNCFTFFKAISDYGNILINKIEIFIFNLPIASIFTSSEKYFLQGFT